MKARHLYDTQEDFKELVNMFVDLEQDGSYLYKVNHLINMLKYNESVCFMFENENKIVGFSIIYADNKGGCIGESLYIKPEYRGTKLFINIFNFLKEYVNKKYAYCNLIASNDTISGLYEKLGYNKKYIVYQYKGDPNG